MSRNPVIIRFAARLRASMARRGMTQTELGARLGVTQPTVSYWCRGLYLPPASHIVELANLLDDDYLRTIGIGARIGQCPCGRRFDRVNSRRMYCSPRCRDRAWKGTGGRVDQRQQAIDAMCQMCEPEGICRDDACPLRGFSPLPFVKLNLGRKAA